MHPQRPAPTLRLECLRFAFPSGASAVDDISFEVGAGEFFCLLGPSGSGKSTLLRLIGGSLAPDSGRVCWDEEDITKTPAERRNMGIVFQSFALFPHLDAVGNVAFGLRARGVGKAARENKAREMLRWVGLQPAECRRLPSQLSGGQQQRVALARALAFDPGLLMLDEPFANLDRSLRERLRDEVRDLQRRLGIATILVTHDRDEALALGDRIAVLDHGKLLQIGTPEAIYRRPQDVNVARLLGHKNVLDRDAAQRCGLGGSALLWAEKLRLSKGGILGGAVKRVAFAGLHQVVTVLLDAGPELQVHAPEDTRYQIEDRVSVEIPADAVTPIPMP